MISTFTVSNPASLVVQLRGSSNEIFSFQRLKEFDEDAQSEIERLENEIQAIGFIEQWCGQGETSCIYGTSDTALS